MRGLSSTCLEYLPVWWVAEPHFLPLLLSGANMRPRAPLKVPEKGPETLLPLQWRASKFRAECGWRSEILPPLGIVISCPFCPYRTRGKTIILHPLPVLHARWDTRPPLRPICFHEGFDNSVQFPLSTILPHSYRTHTIRLIPRYSDFHFASE